MLAVQGCCCWLCALGMRTVRKWFVLLMQRIAELRCCSCFAGGPSISAGALGTGCQYGTTRAALRGPAAPPCWACCAPICPTSTQLPAWGKASCAQLRAGRQWQGLAPFPTLRHAVWGLVCSQGGQSARLYASTASIVQSCACAITCLALLPGPRVGAMLGLSLSVFL